jgi:hypothetical protein
MNFPVGQSNRSKAPDALEAQALWSTAAFIIYTKARFLASQERFTA